MRCVRSMDPHASATRPGSTHPVLPPRSGGRRRGLRGTAHRRRTRSCGAAILARSWARCDGGQSCRCIDQLQPRRTIRQLNETGLSVLTTGFPTNSLVQSGSGAPRQAPPLPCQSRCSWSMTVMTHRRDAPAAAPRAGRRARQALVRRPGAAPPFDARSGTCSPRRKRASTRAAETHLAGRCSRPRTPCIGSRGSWACRCSRPQTPCIYS